MLPRSEISRRYSMVRREREHLNGPYPLQGASVEVQTRGMTYRAVVMVELDGKVANLVVGGVFGAFSPTEPEKRRGTACCRSRMHG